jgi:hypothetical protein
MKNIFIIGIAIFGYWYFTQEQKSVTINYFYSGPYSKEINEGLNYWASNNLQFVKVDDIDSAFLEIKHVDSNYIKKENWAAQYVPRKKTIMLNNFYKDKLHGDYLVSVVAHEAGHFIGLDHNDEMNSIMNYRVKPNMAPSFLDKQRANKKITILYYRKAIEDFLYNDKNNYIGTSYN